MVRHPLVCIDVHGCVRIVRWSTGVVGCGDVLDHDGGALSCDGDVCLVTIASYVLCGAGDVGGSVH